MAWTLEPVAAAALVLSGAVALLAASSCAEVIGLEPFGSTGGASASSGASSGAGGATHDGGAGSSAASMGGGPACETCAPMEHGWMGPVTLVEGDTCSGAKRVVLAKLPLDSPCSNCQCVAVDECQLSVVTGDSADACSTNSPMPIGPGCTQLQTNPAAGVIEFDITEHVGGECDFKGTCSPPTPSTFALCAPEGTCHGGVCVPADAKVCVYNHQPRGCPAAYPHEQPTGYEHYDPMCTCGDASPTNVDCDSASVTTWDDAGCMTGSMTTVPTNQCSTAGAAARYVNYVPNNAGTCAAPTSLGKVSGAVFVCCQ